jgi:UDP-N-acetylmuramoyl-tripeptide--D-alanyl-D-alanine ligase
MNHQSAINLKQAIVIMRGKLLSGKVTALQTFDQVCTDSRQLQAGQVFFALKGEYFDGHTFIPKVLQQGALAVVVHDCYVLPPALASDAIVIAVPDPREALGWIAFAWQSQFDVSKVAITGSCGKTTVKELVRAILSQQGNTLATEGNFNNEIGVPLTLLRIQSEHQFAVIEQGASRDGDIFYTGRWVHPDVSVLLNAAAAHLEGFGSLETIVRTKGQILSFLQPHGTAVINGDDPHLMDWLAQHPHLRHKLLFSLRDDRQTAAGLANVWLKRIIEEDAQGVRCVIGVTKMLEAKRDGTRMDPPASPGESFELTVHSHLQGRHNIANMLAAIAVAIAFNIPAEKIMAGIAAMRAVPGRLQTMSGWREGVILLNDAYNANPFSVRAAIDVLASQPGERILVLGQMAELGDDTDLFHQQMGEYARQCGINQLYAVGPSAAATLAGFSGQGQGMTLEQAAEALLAQTAQSMAVLVKGSRSAGMEKLLLMLLADKSRHPDLAH